MNDLDTLSQLYTEGIIRKALDTAGKAYNAVENGVERVVQSGKGNFRWKSPEQLKAERILLQHKQNFYHIVLQARPNIGSSAVQKNILQQNIDHSQTTEDLEELAKRYKVWSHWQSYKNSLLRY